MKLYRNHKCSICGCQYHYTLKFKNGWICEHCLEYLQEGFPTRRKL